MKSVSYKGAVITDEANRGRVRTQRTDTQPQADTRVLLEESGVESELRQVPIFRTTHEKQRVQMTDSDL